LLQRELGIKPRVTMAGLGMLDVLADGKVIFSYKQAGHMPTDEEILSILKPLVKAS